jgi:hypothetical protein
VRPNIVSRFRRSILRHVLPIFLRSKVGFDDDLFGEHPGSLLSVTFLPALLGAVFIVNFRQTYDSAVKFHSGYISEFMARHLPKTYDLVLSPDMLERGVKKFIDELPSIRLALSTSNDEITFKIFTVLFSATTRQARSNVNGKKAAVAKDMISRPIKRTIKQEEGLDGCMPSKRPFVSGTDDLLSSEH